MFQVQNLGLSAIYRQNGETHRLISQLLQLPMVPARDAVRVFHRLREEVRGPKMRKLFRYVDKRWLNSRVWTPRNWSVYRLAVRTNNDCEGKQTYFCR